MIEVNYSYYSCYQSLPITINPFTLKPSRDVRAQEVDLAGDQLRPVQVIIVAVITWNGLFFGPLGSLNMTMCTVHIHIISIDMYIIYIHIYNVYEYILVVNQPIPQH